MKKVQAKYAQEIFSNYDIDKEALELTVDKQTPENFLNSLLENHRYYDAAVFLAHALPKREAVWWACLCSKAVLSDATDSDNQNALKAAEQWVYSPTEENRRLAENLADKTEHKTPFSWSATAAFWSGGSITAADEPPVPPDPFLYAHAVAGAVNLSANMNTNAKLEENYDNFFTQGINIANGGNGTAQ